MCENKLVENITSRDKDFAQWYTDLCLKAELMDYSDVKGFIIYRPYGYAIWEGIQKYLDQRFGSFLLIKKAKDYTNEAGDLLPQAAAEITNLKLFYAAEKGKSIFQKKIANKIIPIVKELESFLDRYVVGL